MTVSELRLERELSYHMVKSAELDKWDDQIQQIITVFDEREQRLNDTFILSHDGRTRVMAYHKLRELRELRREIKSILATGGGDSIGERSGGDPGENGSPGGGKGI